MNLAKASGNEQYVAKTLILQEKCHIATLFQKPHVTM